MWRVWRLRELADYCRRGPSAAQYVKAFADFLSPRFAAGVRRSAADCVRLLLPPPEPDSSKVRSQREKLCRERCLVSFYGLDEWLSVDEALAVTRDWDATNSRRVELIELEIRGQLDQGQRQELERLQKLAWAKRNIAVPAESLAAIRGALQREEQGENET